MKIKKSTRKGVTIGLIAGGLLLCSQWGIGWIDGLKTRINEYAFLEGVMTETVRIAHTKYSDDAVNFAEEMNHLEFVVRLLSATLEHRSDQISTRDKVVLATYIELARGYEPVDSHAGIYLGTSVVCSLIGSLGFDIPKECSPDRLRSLREKKSLT